MVKSLKFSVQVVLFGLNSYKKSPMLMLKISILPIYCLLLFQKIADEYQQALRDVVTYGVQSGIPTPTFQLLFLITIAIALQFYLLT